jgi:hypothetical protein
VSHRIVPYDAAGLFEAFERRAIPERAFIYRAFLGGRFGRARGAIGLNQ